MINFEKRIEELGITLPEPATPLANRILQKIEIVTRLVAVDDF